MTTTQQPLVVMVGGGITGLSAAYYLRQTAQAAHYSLKVLVVESDKRPGGKIRTDSIGQQQPFIVEGGADAFLAQKPWAADLARELGMGDQLMPINSLQPATSVLVHGRPVPLPEGLRLITPTKLLPFLRSPLMSPWGKAQMLRELVLPARQIAGDESLADFIRARLCAEALDRLGEPLMSGIHNSDPEKQSLLATFPQFRASEQQEGSIIRAAIKAAAQAPPAGSPFLTLRNGMESLVEALTAVLHDHLLIGRRVVSIRPSGGESEQYQVQLDDGTTLAAAAVIVTTPTYVAADLIQAWRPALAVKLRRIEYVSTGTMSLAYHQQDIQLPFAGFGLVIPQSERRALNAITVTSSKIAHRAPSGEVLLRVFFGGFRNPAMIDLDDATLLKLVRRELRSLLGITAPPRFARIYRWRNASPQYSVGHLELVDEITRLAPSHLIFCGSAYGGVGIPDCVRQGQNAGEQVMRELLSASTLPVSSS